MPHVILPSSCCSSQCCGITGVPVYNPAACFASCSTLLTMLPHHHCSSFSFKKNLHWPLAPDTESEPSLSDGMLHHHIMRSSCNCMRRHVHGTVDLGSCVGTHGCLYDQDTRTQTSAWRQSVLQGIANVSIDLKVHLAYPCSEKSRAHYIWISTSSKATNLDLVTTSPSNSAQSHVCSTPRCIRGRHFAWWCWLQQKM